MRPVRSLLQRLGMRLWGLACLVMVACGDSVMPASLVATAPEPPGANCTYGGTAIETGRDLNDNGTLDASEVTSTSYVCQQLAHSLVRVVPEAPGANCANGGQAIEVGVDLDGDGMLEPGEVTSISYVCTGASMLVAFVPEPPGPNCTEGGEAIETGTDLNHDGLLESTEVTSTVYVCDSIIRIDPEPPGPNCSDGGSAVHVGVDANHDGVLEPGEITSTTYLCGQPPPPTVIDGDYTIRNSYDVAVLDGVTSISGDLIFDTSMSSITLPTVQYVGHLVYCAGDSHVGCSNLTTLSMPSLTLVNSDNGEPYGIYLSYGYPDNTSTSSPGQLQTLDLPSLVSGTVELGETSLTELDLPSFDHGEIRCYSAPNLSAVLLPKLTNGDVGVGEEGYMPVPLAMLDLSAMTSGSVGIWASPAATLTSFSLPSAQTVGVTLGGFSDLQAIHLPDATYANLGIFDAPSLATIDAPVASDASIDLERDSGLQTVVLPAVTSADELELIGDTNLSSISAPELTTVWSKFEFENDPAFPTCAAQNLATQAHATNPIITGTDDSATCP